MNSTQDIINRIKEVYQEKGIRVSDDELKEKIKTINIDMDFDDLKQFLVYDLQEESLSN